MKIEKNTWTELYVISKKVVNTQTISIISNLSYQRGGDRDEAFAKQGDVANI